MLKDIEERRLKKAKVTLMRHKDFALYSGVMTMGKTILSETCKSASTNGRDETYGRAFVKQLTDKELAFVVLHENMHKLFRHLFIWKKLYKENPVLANAACDYVLNLILVNSDPHEKIIAMPRKDGKVWGCLDAKYAGMNSKQVFDLLKQQQEEEDKGEGEGGTDVPEGFDEHDWEGAEELSPEEKEAIKKDIEGAIRQGKIAEAKLNGSGAGGMPSELDALITPKVDWREQLREFVNSICSNKDTSSWRRLNRRLIANDIYMPSLVGERVGSVAVGFDASGSTRKPQRTAFISELKHILESVHPEKVDLLYWDSQVENHEVYVDGDMQDVEERTKIIGGGGTDPVCVDRYLKEKAIRPECIIMLTDGYIYDWGNEWEAPILWAIVDNPSCTAPVGKTLHLETEDMR